MESFGVQLWLQRTFQFIDEELGRPGSNGYVNHPPGWTNEDLLTFLQRHPDKYMIHFKHGCSGRYRVSARTEWDAHQGEKEGEQRRREEEWEEKMSGRRNRERGVQHWDPLALRFSHNEVTGVFRDGSSLDRLILDALGSGVSPVERFPALTLFQHEGYLFSLNNRRLYVARVLRHRGLCTKVRAVVRAKEHPDLVRRSKHSPKWLDALTTGCEGWTAKMKGGSVFDTEVAQGRELQEPLDDFLQEVRRLEGNSFDDVDVKADLLAPLQDGGYTTYDKLHELKPWSPGHILKQPLLDAIRRHTQKPCSPNNLLAIQGPWLAEEDMSSWSVSGTMASRTCDSKQLWFQEAQGQLFAESPGELHQRVVPLRSIGTTGYGDKGLAATELLWTNTQHRWHRPDPDGAPAPKRTKTEKDGS